jgi:hypothetical protein
MQENWTPNQLKFIEWLATPKQDRKPETVELLAGALGMNAATLWRWKRLDGFQDAVNALARAAVSSRLPEVYGALLREAEKGSFQHIKLTLELSGDYVERNETKISGSLEITADERAQASKELSEWDKQQRQAVEMLSG